METRELYKITQEFPFTDRAELTIAIKEFEAGLDFVASRHEIREGRHTDSGGENRRFWRVMFYESVERLPVRSHSSSVKPNAPKEAFRFTLKVPRDSTAQCERLVAQACGRRGIVNWRSTLRHATTHGELESIWLRFLRVLSRSRSECSTIRVSILFCCPIKTAIKNPAFAGSLVF